MCVRACASLKSTVVSPVTHEDTHKYLTTNAMRLDVLSTVNMTRRCWTMAVMYVSELYKKIIPHFELLLLLSAYEFDWPVMSAVL